MSTAVAPFTGAWIETRGMVTINEMKLVAPFTGAWIETSGRRSAGSATSCRALHGRVD